MAAHPIQTKPDPLIDPCWDPVFKSIFTRDTPQSQKALRGFLSAVLGCRIEALTVVSGESPVSKLTDRQIRYDINCLLDGRWKANTEMTRYPAGGEPLKIEYYLCRLFTSQELRGTELAYGDLQRCCQVSIFARRNLFKDRHYYHRFIYYDPERGISLGGRTEVITLELKKLAGIAEKPVRAMSALEKWCVYFACYTDERKREVIREIAESGEDIAMADAAVRSFTAAEVEFFHQISKEKYEVDMRTRAAEARERERAKGMKRGLKDGLKKGMERGLADGLRRGLAEGFERAQYESARRMKHLGDSAEKIRIITGLSMEAIAKL